MPKFVYLGTYLSKMNVKFEFSTFEIGSMRNFVKTIKSILFGPKYPNVGICNRSLNNESEKEIPDFPSFEILGRFGSFRNFFGSFRLVSARFGCFCLPRLEQIRTWFTGRFFCWRERKKQKCFNVISGHGVKDKRI